MGGSALDLLEAGAARTAAGTTRVGFGVAYALYARERAGTQPAPSTGRRIEAIVGTLSVVHHFDARWAASVIVPVGTVRDEPGGEATAARLSGLGDVSLSVRYALGDALWGRHGYRPSLVTGLRVGLPTGAHRVGALPNGDAFVPIQLALGTAAWTLGGFAVLTQPLSRHVAVSLDGGGGVPLHANGDGVQFGPRASTRLAAVGSWGPVVAVVGGRYRYVARASKNGGPIANSGGHWVLGEGAVSAALSRRVTVSARVEIPVWEDVRGEQVTQSLTAGVDVRVAFPPPGAGHHRHGSERQATPPRARGHGSGDVADAARAGETFELARALVPGKVTVVDFWASWCRPCAAVGARLEALAARHPRLAVRRVEVPSADSPVAAAWLDGDVRLPLVWIFDGSGRRVAAVRSGDPDVVERAVLDALKSP